MSIPVSQSVAGADLEFYKGWGVTQCNVIGLIKKEGRKEMFCLPKHSTHFIYGYMASDIW